MISVTGYAVYKDVICSPELSRIKSLQSEKQHLEEELKGVEVTWEP